MSIRNVPRSLNWTGGISDLRNFSTTSDTPAKSILDLLTTGEERRRWSRFSFKPHAQVSELFNDWVNFQTDLGWRGSSERWGQHAAPSRSPLQHVCLTAREASVRYQCLPCGCSSHLYTKNTYLHSQHSDRHVAGLISSVGGNVLQVIRVM